MRILFLLYFNVDGKEQLGVSKKVNYQIRAMQQLGHDVTLGYCKENYFILRHNEEAKSFIAPSGLTHYRQPVKKLLKRMSNQFDMIYIRFPGSIDMNVYQTIKMLRRMSKTVVLEMPTYPIGGELVGYLKMTAKQRRYPQLLVRGIAYAIHLLFSRRMYKYLNAIVSYSEYKKIWNTPVINIENGIDCNSITPKKPRDLLSVKNSLRLIFVASFAEWHGVDRVINGLNNYYREKDEQDPDVTLVLVGDSAYLRDLLSELDITALGDHLEVLGAKHGEELDQEYDRADIAISSLGMHRIGLKYGSTLKTREYCAKGIPFIYGYIERGINEGFPYAMRVSADETPIDIQSVIQFSKDVLRGDYTNEMRSFSQKYDWYNQMKIMFEALKV